MNASLGKIDLQCSEAFFEDAMGLCIEALSAFQKSGVQLKSDSVVDKPKENRTSTVVSPSDGSIPTKESPSPPVSSAEENKPKRQRTNSAKAANYSEVELGLNDDQCRDLKQFFKSKAPSVQNDIVATVTVKIKELTNKDEFSVDDIFSALRLIGGVKIPKSLVAVINNMYKLGLAGRNDGKLVVNYATEDRVNLELPSANKDQ